MQLLNTTIFFFIGVYVNDVSLGDFP